MQKITLIRTSYSDQGTFGYIIYGPFWRYTGELPDRGNASNISCIPVGKYPVIWSKSPRLGRYTYEIKNVPNRSGIRIHPSNLMGDSSLGFKAQLRGCISLGEKIGLIGKQRALLLSGNAVKHFERFVNKEPFELIITDLRE